MVTRNKKVLMLSILILFSFFSVAALTTILKKTQLPTTTMYNDQSNTISTGLLSIPSNQSGTARGIKTTLAGFTGAPSSGSHVAGEHSYDSTGALYLCTADGSPGTWQKIGPSTAAAASMSSVSGGYVSRSGNDIIFLPDKSNRVFCYESSVWTEKTIPDAGITVAGTTGLTAGSDYSIYVYDSGGTLTLDITQTGTVTQNGIPVKGGATSRTFLALCRANASGDVDTWVQDPKRNLLCNWYNRRAVHLACLIAANTYGSTTTRAMNNDQATNHIEFISVGQEPIFAFMFDYTANAASAVAREGMALDVTNAFQSESSPYPVSIGSAAATCTNFYSSVPSVGWHSLNQVQQCSGNFNCDFGIASLGTQSALVFQ